MRKIRVAQIGLNEYSHATFVFKSMKKQAELFDIAGVVLPEKERERYPAIARVFDGVPALTLDEVLADPAIEAVVVETDEVYLTQYALLAAQAG
ncbi:MAG: hypothetical protein J6X61_00730 [Clostridia bacterium]|nr:hypothetical protein [Clostridia bacterium]